VFRYSAKLVNVGLKPLRIERVYIDYGGETIDRSWHAVVDGLSDIPPGGGERQILFRLGKSDYEGTLSKFGINHCLVRLRVRYFNVTGGIVAAERGFEVERGRCRACVEATT
jgi:hypothetical protein